MSVLHLPGLVDAHVHLREPGAAHKEDVYSGTIAALAGGVVAVLDMPNNTPPIVDQATLAAKEEAFSQKAVCDYGLFCGFDGEHLAPMLSLADRVVGLKLYVDETFGDLLTAQPEMLERVFEAWPGPGPIAVHAESRSLPNLLDLAQRYGQHCHVCHVPHPDDLLRIEAARQAGADITCEVTPHHLFLDDLAVARLGPLAQMKPPLLPHELVDRYWQRLALVDIIATDHAPHTLQEKGSDNPPPGVPGLETMLPLLLWAVEQGKLSLARLIELTHAGPLRVYGLQTRPGCDLEVDVGQPYELPRDGYLTKCGWSPFAGQPALGRVRRVRLGGETVWEQGMILASPGSGRPLARRVGD